jgi:hypothetical protein
MKKIVLLVLLTSVFACSDPKGDYKAPENALDAGREFIDNSLKGHFSTAKKYMLQSEENNYWLDKVSKDYNQYTEQVKAGYSGASITILEVADPVADSITIINYSNSYIKRPQKLKVVKYNGEWKVDLNYTFSENGK